MQRRVKSKFKANKKARVAGKFGEGADSEIRLSGGFVRQYFEACQIGRNMDETIIKATQSLMDAFGISVITAFILEHSDDGTEYVIRNGGDSIYAGSIAQAWEAAVKFVSDKQHNGRQFGISWVTQVAPDIGGLLFINDIERRDEWGRAVQVSATKIAPPTSLCLLCFPVHEKSSSRLARIISRSSLRLSQGEFLEFYHDELCEFLYATLMALAYRERAVSCFPRLFREAIWNDLEHTRPGKKGVRRPWSISRESQIESGQGGRSTITLSLDLRKSTFSMNEARDMKLYANWIEAFVIILRRIAHDNFAVFDKFTGDGIIAHFLVNEIDAVLTARQEVIRESFFGHDILYGIEAPTALGMPSSRRWRENSKAMLRSAFLSLRCAREMIVAVECHLRHLSRDNLRFGSSLAGAGIGLACDTAMWSIDRDGNPVVVGPGVVNACRLTDADAGTIQMPNDLAQQLMNWRKDLGLERYPLSTHKDYGSGSGVEAWKIKVLPGGLARGREQIATLCDSIWMGVLRRDPWYVDSQE